MKQVSEPKNTSDQEKLIQKKTEQPKVVQSAIIGDYYTAPKYMKDNQHITHGYRINFNSPVKIFRSLFMVHNQSVNIWSHFIPAIIICVIIISFTLIVDKNMTMNQITKYQQQFSQGFQHFTHAIGNLTLFEDMKNMKQKTQTQIMELQSNIIESFTNFKSKLNQNIQHLYEEYDKGKQHLKQSLSHNFQQNLKKLQMMKNDYQRIIAPQLINQLNSLNNTYINSIRDQFYTLKQQIDSDHYKYLDILHSSPNPHHVSRWPIIVFLGSAFVCLFCSTLFHLFYPMSDKSYKIFSRFDYAGISLLIAGSSFPTLYYGMYCYLQVAFIYSLIAMILAVSIFILSVFQWMHRPEHSFFKAAIYGGFGLFNIIPITHLLINDLYFDQGDQFSFTNSIPYYVLIGFSYLSGLYIYTIRCPERHYPGKFNLCGHSHQIWHICVVIGIIFTYCASVENLQMRKNHACPV